MEKLVVRGRGLLRRPLSSPCIRWGATPLSSSLSPSQSPSHRRPFSCASLLAAKHTPQDRFKLPDTPCRTRFAPSPTGYLHLGSLRTLLYNYLLARATGGQFLLRIEDTDQTRLVADAETRLYQDLEWLGLAPDEGPNNEGPYGPYRQSERLPHYHEHADKLIRDGKAYRCFCTPESLEEAKAMAAELGQSTAYPGTCRSIAPDVSDDRANKGEKFAVRFKSSEKPIMIHDIVYNRFQKKDAEEDFIIMKRDGFPTYHFANVVDDHLMKITHVIRGAEWLVSTPKHVELYNAFGWQPPQFAHVGLLVDKNRQKLSKRDNSANMEFYKQGHILPSALANFAALLGWRAPPINKGDVMTLKEMADNFSLKFSKGDIIVSLLKLPHLQDKHFQRVAESHDPADLALVESHFLEPLERAIRDVETLKAKAAAAHPSDLGSRLPDAPILQERFRSVLTSIVLGARLPLAAPADRFAHAVWRLRYYLWEVPPHLLQQQLRTGALEPVAPRDAAARLADAVVFLRRKFAGVAEQEWNHVVIDQAMREVIQDEGYAAYLGGDNAQLRVYKPLRWAMLALDKGLGLSQALEILGKEECLRRLDVAKEAAETVAAQPPSQTPPVEEAKGNILGHEGPQSMEEWAQNFGLVEKA